MDKWVISAKRQPYAYNQAVRYVIEAETGEDALAILKDQLGDPVRSLAGSGYNLTHDNHGYSVPEPYTPPPPGRIIASHVQ
jgi:hypothetical protein